MNKHYIYIGLFLLLCLSLVSSAPPVRTVQEFPEGYVIVESQHLYLVLNQDYQYNFFVYNKSNGILIDNTTLECNFFLANSSGEVIYSNAVEYFSDGHWGIDIIGGNFSSIGTYPYGVSCQDGNGGALAGIFEVTNTGNEPPSDNIILFFILGFMAIFFFGIIYFFKALKEFTLLEMDLFDTIILMCSYFIMWLFYYFQMIYLNNPLMNDFLVLAISIGSITHVLLPLIGLFTSFILNTLKFKQKQRVTY